MSFSSLFDTISLLRTRRGKWAGAAANGVSKSIGGCIAI
jgi:hypothetical protein